MLVHSCHVCEASCMWAPMYVPCVCTRTYQYISRPRTSVCTNSMLPRDIVGDMHTTTRTNLTLTLTLALCSQETPTNNQTPPPTCTSVLHVTCTLFYRSHHFTNNGAMSSNFATAWYCVCNSIKERAETNGTASFNQRV